MRIPADIHPGRERNWFSPDTIADIEQRLKWNRQSQENSSPLPYAWRDTEIEVLLKEIRRLKRRVNR